MRAAGRTLTVGELREATAGLRDDDPVRVRADDGTEVEVHAVDGGRRDALLAVRCVPLDETDREPLLDLAFDALGDDETRADLRSKARRALLELDLITTAGYPA